MLPYAGLLHQYKAHNLTLASENNDTVAVAFATAIRAADTDKMKEILEKNSTDVLHAKMSLNITMHLSYAMQQKTIQNSGNIATVKLIVTPIHIAIIAKQDAAVKWILGFVVSKCNNHVSAGNEENEVQKILAQKTEVKFQSDAEMYSYNDRILDGVNVFHLATRFSPQSLHQIFKILKQERCVAEADLISLLDEKDPHLGKTPLHISARVPNHFATW